MRTLARRLSVVAAAIALIIVALAAPASAAWPTGWSDVQISASASGTCIAVPAPGYVLESTCAYGPHQSWTIVAGRDANTYTIQNTGTGRCLTAAAVNNSAVGVTTCSGAVSQLWLIPAAGYGHIMSYLGDTPGGWTTGPFCLKHSTTLNAQLVVTTTCASNWSFLS